MKYGLSILFLLFSSSIISQINFQEFPLFSSTKEVQSAKLPLTANVDINGDGHNDIWIYTDRKTGWYENTDGLGTFGTFQTIADYTGFLSNPLKDANLVDFDQDGDLDVVLATVDRLSLYENTDGLGNFGPEQILLSAGTDKVEVFDVLGQRILSNASDTGNHQTLPVGDLTSGIYIVQIQTSEGMISKSFMKK